MRSRSSIVFEILAVIDEDRLYRDGGRITFELQTSEFVLKACNPNESEDEGPYFLPPRLLSPLEIF